LIDTLSDHLVAAVLKNGQLYDLYVDHKDDEAIWASIYFGRVERIDTKLDAAFVNLGNGLTGFLPAKHVHKRGEVKLNNPQDMPRRQGIAELVTIGEMIVVQIKAEAISESVLEHAKYPRLTTRLYFPSCYMIYSPQATQIVCSSEFEATESFKNLRPHLGERGGWFIQAAAHKMPLAILQRESEMLLASWQRLKENVQDRPREPHLILKGPDAVLRALMDYMGVFSFHLIESSDALALKRAENWVSANAPHLYDRIKFQMYLTAKEKFRLLEAHDLLTEIDHLFDPLLPLPNEGGELVFEKTQAFTVIDINRGRGDSVVGLNLEASKAVARQLRLRNISGVVLVDFVNMLTKQDRYKVISTLERAIRSDPALTQVHGFTRLQIAEITRKRRSASLAEKIGYLYQT
jgi:Rne/Rng family ribonuclease